MQTDFTKVSRYGKDNRAQQAYENVAFRGGADALTPDDAFRFRAASATGVCDARCSLSDTHPLPQGICTVSENEIPVTTYDGINSTSSGGVMFTVDQAVEHLGFGRFQWFLSAATGLAWMAEAMEMMLVSFLSSALSCDWGISSWQQALITTVVFCGMMVGSGPWGTFSDTFGRKTVLIFTTVVTFYFGVLSAWSPTYVWMLIMRALVGIGISGGAQSVTLYSEFLPVAARAKSLVAIEVFFSGGTFVEVVIAYFVMPTLGWRWLLMFSAIPLLLFLLLSKWVPESARYDMMRGRHDKALATLRRIAKVNKKLMPEGRLVAPSKSFTQGRLHDLLTPELRRTTLTLWIIWFANTFCYYGIVLMSTELMGLEDDELCSASSSGRTVEPTCTLDCHPLDGKDYGDLMWTTAAEFPGLLLTFFIVDIIGRRWTMLGEFCIFSAFVALVAVCAGRTAMVVFVFIARAMMSGAFQVALVYTPEVYPTNCRAVGLGSCFTFSRIGALTTPFVAQVLLRRSLYSALAIYSAVAVTAAVLSRMLPIETKGRPLDEASTATSS